MSHEAVASWSYKKSLKGLVLQPPPRGAPGNGMLMPGEPANADLKLGGKQRVCERGEKGRNPGPLGAEASLQRRLFGDSVLQKRSC